MRQISDSIKSGYANLPDMQSRGVKHNLMVLDEEELERKLVRVAAKQQNHNPNGAGAGGGGGLGAGGPGMQRRVLSPAPLFKNVSISPINRTYISDMENLTSNDVSPRLSANED